MSRSARSPLVRQLCHRCDVELFEKLIQDHPSASLNELGRLARRHLGWAPAPGTLVAFFDACGLVRPTPGELTAMRHAKQSKRVQRTAPAVEHGAERKRLRERVVKQEHRAIAHQSSIFTLAGGLK